MESDWEEAGSGEPSDDDDSAASVADMPADSEALGRAWRTSGEQDGLDLSAPDFGLGVRPDSRDTYV